MSDHFSLSEDELNTKLNHLSKIVNSFTNLSKEKTESAMEDGKLKMEKIHTSQNPTDMLTKGVTREKLSSCSVSVGLQD